VIKDRLYRGEWFGLLLLEIPQDGVDGQDFYGLGISRYIAGLTSAAD